MPNFQEDQAASLRRIMAKPKPRVVSILSTHSDENQPRLITNLAAAINKHDSDVLIVHAAQESSEASRSYSTNALPTLLDVAQRRSLLLQSIKNSKFGFSTAKLLPKNQIQTPLDSNTDEQLNGVFKYLAGRYEIVLVDTTLNNNHALPLTALNESQILIQLTRDPESIKQAYVLIKQICNQLGTRSFGIIVSSCSDAQAAVVYRHISQVARRFMLIDLEFFGAIPADEHINRAAKLGRTVIDAYPLAAASIAIKSLAQRLNYKQTYSAQAELASLA